LGVITAGVVAVVFVLKSVVSSGSQGNAGSAVGNVTAAATNTLLTQGGNALFGVGYGVDESIAGAYDSYTDDSLVDPVQLVNGPGTPEYIAAQQYAAAGYPGN